jgi:hypothetical protein
MFVTGTPLIDSSGRWGADPAFDQRRLVKDPRGFREYGNYRGAKGPQNYGLDYTENWGLRGKKTEKRNKGRLQLESLQVVSL